MKTYEEFINDILMTRGRFACGDEYHEKHHVLPRCMGGTNDKENLIHLFAKEHFEAHRLLALENPDNDKLVYAWWAMCHLKDNNQERYEVTPEEYEEAKKVFSKKISEIMKVQNAGENNPNYNKKMSEETCKKMSESRKGDKNPNYGNVYSEEFKRKLSEAVKNSEKFKNRPTVSDETRKKISEARKGKPHPHKGHAITEDQRKKASERLKGKCSGSNNYHYGKGIAVVQLTLDGEFVAEYYNMRAAGEAVGIKPGNIGEVCKHKKGFDTAGGYKWMTKEEYLTTQNN